MLLANHQLLVVAIIALLVGTGVLIAMVRYDLGPKGSLAQGGQWLLATALGTGILAFAIKLLMILTMINLPQLVIDPLIEKSPQQRPPSVIDPLLGLLNSRRFIWQPLARQTEIAVQAVTGNNLRTPYVWAALPTLAPSPDGHPTTPAKVALGERLFFDKRLSRDGTLSCSSCHDIEGGSGGDGLATSRGIDGQMGSRNAPTVWNTAFQSVLFWDGRAASLEEQAKGPMVNPLEMGMPSLTEVEGRVRQDDDYQAAFQAVFGGGEAITIDRIAEAIAAYERTLITPDSPYDRFVRGELDALTPAQQRGMSLFQNLGCVQCHSGPNFSAASLFDARAPMRIFPIHPTPYEVKYALTQDGGATPAGQGRGSWRVPSLRNVALTGPWLHNGSVDDLAEVVRIMSSVQLGYTGGYQVWSDSYKTWFELDRPRLTDDAVQDIVAFLQALSSDMLVQRVRENGE
jgi:cytochrome c peroxidase